MFLIAIFPFPANAADEDPALAVLEQNCIECHNQDDAKGDVVLDRAPLGLEDPATIIEMVSGSDPEMPKDGSPLLEDEIAALKKWVKAGAKIPEGRVLKNKNLAGLDWWSLKPIQQGQAAESTGSDRKWARNVIDRFVLAKLKENNLAPSPEADPRTLGRRVYYDLTGLPPTPEEMEIFLKSHTANPASAFEKLVDQLLESDAYGEHWARHWLDVARYGETHGYDKDKLRPNAWPYRDYVIQSLNDDKPWWRFVQEQIAGDALFPGDPDGIVALGFIAAGPWDFIAHYEVGEQKVDGRIAKHMDRDDMVSAVFNAFMSTTVQCAQCHHHKFDPVTMEDYYRLHTIFAAVDRRPRIYDLDPAVVAKRQVLEKEIEALNAKKTGLEKQIATEGGPELEQLRKKIAELEKAGAGKIKKESAFGYHSQIVGNSATEKWVQVALEAPAAIREVVLVGCHDEFGNIGAGFGFPVRYRVQIADDLAFEKNVRTIGDRTKDDQPNPGILPVRIDGGGVNAKFIRVTATKLVERKNDYIFALAELQVIDAEGKNVAAGAGVTALDSIEAPVRWAKKNLTDRKFPTGGDEKAMRELAGLKAQEQAFLDRLNTPEIQKKRETIDQQLAAKKKSLAELPEGKLVYAAATHFKKHGNVVPTGGKPRPIRLLHRGDILSPGDEMRPGAPALWNEIAPEFVLDPKATEGERRAALALYLTDRNNPLTWRSIVNRVWLYHFGRGIVDSPNDFGRMGMEPTHPELLDWLAAEFRDDPKQSLKKLHRLIVTSATWRQRSAHDPAKAVIDANNAYYWRGNRRRLSAEELRDSVLAAAGKLNREMGGPSFQDFVIEKPEHSPHFEYHLHDHNDPKAQRRSIYRMIVRSKTQPFLTTLDCADPSQMVAKRDETTTALQALSLMNNPFMETMAGHFAKRVEKAEDPIGEAFRIATGRMPSEGERSALSAYSAGHGMANVCRMILNLSEFVYVD